jgi:hypothetical protein
MVSAPLLVRREIVRRLGVRRLSLVLTSPRHTGDLCPDRRDLQVGFRAHLTIGLRERGLVNRVDILQAFARTVTLIDTEFNADVAGPQSGPRAHGSRCEARCQRVDRPTPLSLSGIPAQSLKHVHLRYPTASLTPPVCAVPKGTPLDRSRLVHRR